MEQQEKTLQDYIAVLSRRKVSIIVTMMVVFLLGVVVALVWPPTYRSSATILIKEQEIPVELVRSTVTSYATQRIQTISQRVMTRNNLMQIIEKYNLYVEERKQKTSEQVLEEMRQDINLDMISSDVVDPRTGRPGTATIAFTLSFQGSNPSSTQKVAGELTSLFLAENLKTRKEKASETYVFLTDETDKLSEKITEIENKLADFKEQHSNSLPEMSAMNLSMLSRVENELVQVEADLRSNKEKRFYLESQLAQINPLTNMRSATGVSILDPVSRLKALEAEYVSMTAKYSPQHPDVIKIKREIEGLKQQVGESVDYTEKAKELSAKKSELGTVQKKYGDSHPDVVKLKKVISRLEKDLKSASSNLEKDIMQEQPDNPAYISILTQLKTVKSAIQSVKERRSQLKKKLAELEKRIANTPVVEKEYQKLNRERSNALARYQDIKSRQMEAEIGQQMEKESKGESFILIDPAQFPERPIKPNRIAIGFMAFILAIVCGTGLAVLQEMLDSSIRGTRSITNMLTSPPLAVIPFIYNTQDLLRKKRATRWVFISIIAGIFSVVLFVHFFLTPLDVLWFRAMRKAENIITL